MSRAAILVNGQPGALVSTEDRGLLYGDGLFETLAVRGGRAVALELHWQRLAAGCLRLGLQCPDSELLADEIATVCNEYANAVAKIIVTRGQGARGYAPSGCDQPLRIVAAYPWPENLAERQRLGIPVTLSAHRLGDQADLAGLKHLARLEQVMAARDLGSGEFTEALVCDTHGRLVEALSSNVFVAVRGRVLTPGLERCGVAGVMRGRVLTAARKLAIPAGESELPLTVLGSCDEMFLTNSIGGIVPVNCVNQRRLEVGALTQQLQGLLHEDWPS